MKNRIGKSILQFISVHLVAIACAGVCCVHINYPSMARADAISDAIQAASNGTDVDRCSAMAMLGAQAAKVAAATPSNQALQDAFYNLILTFNNACLDDLSVINEVLNLDIDFQDPESPLNFSEQDLNRFMGASFAQLVATSIADSAPFAADNYLSLVPNSAFGCGILSTNIGLNRFMTSACGLAKASTLKFNSPAILTCCSGDVPAGGRKVQDDLDKVYNGLPLDDWGSLYSQYSAVTGLDDLATEFLTKGFTKEMLQQTLELIPNLGQGFLGMSSTAAHSVSALTSEIFSDNGIFAASTWTNAASLTIQGVIHLVTTVAWFVGAVIFVLFAFGVFGRKPSTETILRRKWLSSFGECQQGKVKEAQLLGIRVTNDATITQLKAKGMFYANPTKVKLIRAQIDDMQKQSASIRKTLDKGYELVAQQPRGGHGAPPMKKVQLTPAQITQYSQNLDAIDQQVLATELKIIDIDLRDTVTKAKSACDSYCPARNRFVDYYSRAEQMTPVVKKFNAEKAKGKVSAATRTQRGVEAAKSVDKIMQNLKRFYILHLAKAIKMRNLTPLENPQGRYSANLAVIQQKELVLPLAQRLEVYLSYLTGSESIDPTILSDAKKTVARLHDGSNSFTVDPKFSICPAY